MEISKYFAAVNVKLAIRAIKEGIQNCSLILSYFQYSNSRFHATDEMKHLYQSNMISCVSKLSKKYTLHNAMIS